MPTKRNYVGEQQNYVPKGNEAGGKVILKVEEEGEQK